MCRNVYRCKHVLYPADALNTLIRVLCHSFGILRILLYHIISSALFHYHRNLLALLSIFKCEWIILCTTVYGLLGLLIMVALCNRADHYIFAL